MFEGFDKAMPYVERMRGKERSANDAPVERAELDMLVNEVLLPLFRGNRVQVTATKIESGWTLDLRYRDYNPAISMPADNSSPVE